MRLHSRIYLYVLGVLLVVGLATSLVFVMTFGPRGAPPVREVAERLARHVGSLLAEAFADRAALARRVEQLHRDLEIDLTVRDLDGRVLAASGGERPALGASEARRVRDGEVIVAGRGQWSVTAPVRDGASGTVVGTLQATTRRRFGPGAGLWRPLLIVALVLVLVAVVTRPLARRLARPLERLTEAARRLGDGDLGARVPDVERRHRWRKPPAAEELGALTRAFNDMAERVERMVRGQKQLLANVSHELRSPLARIRVALELVPRHGDAERRLRDIEGDLTELDGLIEDVLTTARLDATGLPTRLAPLDVRRLLDQVAERARLDPVTAGAAVRVEGLPLDLIADEALLRRALWNLVENAAKYGAPPITLSAAEAGPLVTMSVTDEGEGIPPALRTQVFEPFYRGDPARTPRAVGEAPRGVGLGLTLARRVAEVHGGTITIAPASVVDGRERGCRITLTLPRDSAHSAA